VEVAPDISEELLQAADQYMLEPLKRLCEAAIAADLSTDNLPTIYDLSENFNAPQLGRHCMLYALEHYEELVCPLCSLFLFSCCCRSGLKFLMQTGILSDLAAELPLYTLYSGVL